ncbi:MAG TPA: VCBS repeat-containing protein [Opitutaceae bacterium]|nr:VCBS repeat-containing protein [Opitutaceae bacterium]
MKTFARVCFFSVAGFCFLNPVTAAPEPPDPGAAARGPALRFSEHLVWNDFSYGFGLQAIDVNGDGHLDLTVADTAAFVQTEPFSGEDLESIVDWPGNNRPAVSKSPRLRNSHVYWFENDGKGGFTRRFIARNDVNRRLERHVFGDINRDGRPDLVIVDNLLGDLVWYENPGKEAIARGDLWKKRFIAKGTMLGAVDVTLADFDGDGWLDAAGAGWRLGEGFKWFKNPGRTDREDWAGHVIDSAFAHATAVLAGDIDRDGRMDLLATSSTSRAVMWYQCPQKPSQQPWKRNIIDLTPGGEREPVFMKFADLNRDGRLDVVLAWGGYGNRPEGEPRAGAIIWYEQGDVVEGRVQWKKHLIGQLRSATDVAIGDLDGDGALDVAAIGFMPGEVSVFRNSGDPSARWVKETVKSNWPNVNQVVIADLDGDGRADLAAVADYGAMELRWWRNEGTQ